MFSTWPSSLFRKMRGESFPFTDVHVPPSDIHSNSGENVTKKENIMKTEEIFHRKITFNLENLDLLSISFIIVIFLSFAATFDKITPYGQDCWYHMAVARKVIESHTLPSWDTWEFQPVGRPHLYPPLLHLLITLFSRDAEHVIEGAMVVRILIYPSALFTSWYFTRWLFSSKIAFIALVILSMDYTFLAVFKELMSSTLFNVFFPLLMISFLSKRLWASVFFMVLCFYSHLSFPFLALFCLLVVSCRYRIYLSFYAKFFIISLIFYVPWAFRIVVFHDFLRTFTSTFVDNPFMGIIIGFFSFQIINPLFLLMGMKGLKKKEGGQNLIRLLLIGFLPVLIFYGGRYWSHTAPFWAAGVALFFEKYISSRKRIAILLLCAFIPQPLLAMEVPEQGPFIIGMTALDEAVYLFMSDPVYNADDGALKAFIEQHTQPDQIIHVDRGFLADKIVVLTGRPVDNGMWFEVGNDKMWATIENARLHERPAVFVYIDKGELPLEPTLQIGRYWIAVRE